MRAGARVQIVGAGPAGALLALLLAQRGLAVRVFERRADPRTHAPERGRSINLALAARGLRALERAGLLERIQPLLVPMRGRLVHQSGLPVELQPYGQAAHEQIYSVSRAELTRALVTAADSLPNIELRFEQRLISASPQTNALFFADDRGGGHYQVGIATTIAADGGGSAARQSLAAAGWLEASEDLLAHRYKELNIPPCKGQPAMRTDGLHIWPRRDFMLIALPNPDASFTCTLFLAAQGGTESFQALDAPDAARAFFTQHFADALALMPDFDAEFAQHPLGILGTVRTSRWALGSQLLLLGDAAHAIVPFHGQGMNCAFEDCLELADLADAHDDWAPAFAAYESARRPNVEAIAQMALENYREMRDEVTDPDYLAERALALALERAFPGRIIPRYSMVMFHPEIPYAAARQRGAALEHCVRALRRAGLTARSTSQEFAAHPSVQALLAG